MGQLDKLALNNFVVLKRSLARQAKDHTIKKLVRCIRKLREKEKKTTNDKMKGKFTRKADKLGEEILFLKHLHSDEVMKFALMRKKSFNAVVANPDSRMEERALCRLAEHEGLNTAITNLRQQYVNWQEEVPFLIKGLGIRHREKKLKQLKKVGKLKTYLEREHKQLKLLQDITDIDINPELFKQQISDFDKKQSSSRSRKRKREQDLEIGTTTNVKQARVAEVNVDNENAIRKIEMTEVEKINSCENLENETKVADVNVRNRMEMGVEGKYIGKTLNENIRTGFNMKNGRLNEKIKEKVGTGTESDDEENESLLTSDEDDDGTITVVPVGGNVENYKSIYDNVISESDPNENESDPNESDNDHDADLTKKLTIKFDLVSHTELSESVNCDNEDNSDGDEGQVATINTSKGTSVVKQLDLKKLTNRKIENISGKISMPEESDDEDFFTRETNGNEKRKSNFFLGGEGDNGSSSDDGSDGQDDFDSSKYFRRNLYREKDGSRKEDMRGRGDGRWNRKSGKRDSDWNSNAEDSEDERGQFNRRGRGGRGRGRGDGKWNRESGKIERDWKANMEDTKDEGGQFNRRGRGMARERGGRWERERGDKDNWEGGERRRANNRGQRGGGRGFGSRFGRGDDGSNANMVPVASQQTQQPPPSPAQQGWKPSGSLMHPSWMAKRQQTASINSYQGHRMVFDD